MYGFEKIVCLVLLVVSALAVLGQNVTNSSCSGFGYELITSKLDYLQYKLIEMDFTVREDRETIDQKLAHQETLADGLLWAIHQLDQTIDYNLTALQDKSNSVLQQGRASMEHNEMMSYNITRLQTQSYSALKEVQEAIDQKVAVLTGAINKLNRMISHNITSLLTKTDKILSQQTACANHEKMRQEIQRFTSNVEQPPKLVVKLDPDVQSMIPRSCKEAGSKSGKYLLQSHEPFVGYCDQTVYGGGWLVIQYRFNGSLDFNRNWNDYRNGFGSVDGEFWLGLERIHRLTSARSNWLLVELKDLSGNYYYAWYNQIEIGSEAEKYSMKKLGSYTGTARDSLSYNKGKKFTTKDQDNDLSSLNNCASDGAGGWWFGDCTNANLNGNQYLNNSQKAFSWYHLKNNFATLAYSRMLIRDIN